MSKKSATFRMNPITRALAVLASLAIPGLALAEGLDFSTEPPTNISSGGALPNVIVAVDGTGSMGAGDSACKPGSVKDAFGNSYTLACTSSPESRLNALSDALLTVFSDPALVGNIRLAFQATSIDAGFGPNRFNPSTHDNSMKVFTKEYQADFMKWASELKSNGFGCNPTEPMVAYAGEYLKGQWVSADARYYTCEFGGANQPKYRTTGTYVPGSGPSSPDPNLYLKFDSIPTADNPWNSNAKLRTKLATSDASDATEEEDSSRLSCRRGYLIFMTDGGVNGNQFAPVGTNDNNFGGSVHALPDGATYDPAKYYGKVYSDLSPNNYADHALYYWITDLTGKGKDVVAPKMPVTSDETFTYKLNDSKTYSQTYEPFWNPKNDPATWQHMQTYTVGFGASGAGDLPSGLYNNPAGYNVSPKINLPIGFDGYDKDGNVLDYDKFFQMFATGAPMDGAMSWPWVSDCDGCSSSGGWHEVTLDVYHAALAGRGKYYPAASVDALSAAFKDILSTTITQSAPGGVSSAAGSSIQWGSNSMRYKASYTYDSTATGSLAGWSGLLECFVGDSAADAAPIWTAKIPGTRQIFTADATGQGVVFTAANTGIADTTIKTVRENLLLGDIVNSQLVYVGKPTLLSLDANYGKFAQTVNAFNGSSPNKYRQGMIYVGANDGMLHGFDAGNGMPNTASGGYQGTGEERFAYVPRGLLSSLDAFGPAYKHRYWVDSGMFSGDAQLDRSSYGIGTNSGGNPGHWATVLAGTLGAGGKGYFVLDVTKPDDIVALNKALVLIDTTDLGALAGQVITSGEASEVGLPVSDYIGHQFSQPVLDMYNLTFQSSQIVRINTDQDDGEWAVIMGNGYNNTKGVPVLLIQSLSQPGRPLYTVAAKCAPAGADCKAAGNGLSAPRPVDVDGNGTADFVYAGDLMGNLWKFDISNVKDRSNWDVAYKGEPMFTAVGPTGKAQPITSAPVVVPNKKGGFMVGFGTGKNLTQEDTTDAPDPANAPRNSFYALYDVEKMSVEQIEIKAASGSVPAVKASQVNLDETTLSMPCKATTGTARYASCLYERKDGVLSTTVGIVSHGKTDNTDLTGKIDGTTKLGWYYDIPETDNGNAAKVLANPMMMSDTMVLFLSDNVASSNSSAGESNDTEACDTVTVSNGTQTTINFFDLFTGARPPDNSITVTIGGVTITTDNRIRIKGPVKFVRDGTDGLVIMGLPGKNGVHYEANDSAGRRAGWRFGR